MLRIWWKEASPWIVFLAATTTTKTHNSMSLMCVMLCERWIKEYFVCVCIFICSQIQFRIYKGTKWKTDSHNDIYTQYTGVELCCCCLVLTESSEMAYQIDTPKKGTKIDTHSCIDLLNLRQVSVFLSSCFFSQYLVFSQWSNKIE